MSENKHSRLPYHVEIDAPAHIICDADGVQIACCMRNDNQTEKEAATAEFISLACNCHHELLAAGKTTIDLFLRLGVEVEWRPALAALTEAVAKAEGGAA